MEMDQVERNNLLERERRVVNLCRELIQHANGNGPSPSITDIDSVMWPYENDVVTNEEELKSQAAEGFVRKTLGSWIQPDRKLYSNDDGIDVTFPSGGKADLNGHFTADQLEAIAWWMRHKFVQGKTEEGDVEP